MAQGCRCEILVFFPHPVPSIFPPQPTTRPAPAPARHIADGPAFAHARPTVAIDAHGTDLQSILILGSGPIVIGQAAEFDYSGA